MKLLVVFALALVAYEAEAYGYLPIVPGVARIPVLGGLGGNSYGVGGTYGRNGYVGGANGYGSSGYQTGGAAENHDIGHREDDFQKVVSSHHSSDHNIGGSGSYGSGGGLSNGFNNYRRGNGVYSNGYNTGVNGYIP